MDQLPRLGKRELIFLLSFTCNYVVFVWRGFLFLWVLGMGYVILSWHSLSLPYNYLPHKNPLFVYAKKKTQISFAVTAKLISAFVFATQIVQSLYFLNQKIQASGHLLWLYTPKTGFLTTRLSLYNVPKMQKNLQTAAE